MQQPAGSGITMNDGRIPFHAYVNVKRGQSTRVVSGAGQAAWSEPTTETSSVTEHSRARCRTRIDRARTRAARTRGSLCSMRPRTVALLALAVAVIAASCGPAQRSTPSADPAASATADSLRPAILPITAPQIVAAAAAPGARATLVNVWASWCAPCREEFPGLLQVARAHRSEGLRFILVSADFDDQLSPARQFLREHGYADTSFVKTGDDMSFIQTLTPKWSGALPATLVYDARGRLVSFWEGMADPDRFEHAVRQALAGGPS